MAWTAKKPESISREYAATFVVHCPLAPVNYLLALAQAESRMNPRAKTGSHLGLFQISTKPNGVWEDWKRATKQGAQSTKNLFVPSTNTQVFCWWLRKWLSALAVYMPVDWKNREVALLTTAAWNSGWSKGGRGVLHMLQWLQNRSKPLTHENVWHYAATADAVQYLREDKHATKKAWQREVVRQFDLLEKDIPLPITKTELLTEAVHREALRVAEAADKKAGTGPEGGYGWLILLLLMASQRD